MAANPLTPGKPSAFSRRWLAILSPLLLLLCFGFFLANTLEYQRQHNEVLEEHKLAYQTSVSEAANTMQQLMQSVEQAAESLALRVSDGSLASAQYEQALAAMVQEQGLFYGGAIAFAPYALSADRRLYAPYYGREGDELKFTYIEQGYDYTADEQEWFAEAMASGSRWSKPYFDEGLGNILMTTYSAVVNWPDENGNHKPVAVVTIDVAIEEIGDVVKGLDMKGSGYAEIISGEGLYLYSPEQSRVLERTSAFSNSRWVDDRGLAGLRALIGGGKSGTAELTRQRSGDADWVSAAPIPTTPWYIMGHFSADDVAPHTPELRHLLMRIILAAVLFLGIALIYRQGAPGAGVVIRWRTSILFSLVLAIGISLIWRVAMSYASENDRDTFALTSKQAVDRQSQAYQQRAREHLAAEPVAIPTGIYIESMKFHGSSDVRIVGGIWQKLDLVKHKDIEPGIIFPGADKMEMDEPFVAIVGDSRLLRWQFSGEWRFDHHYARYPLVKDVFGIGFFPRDTADNILLIPDVDSYPYMAPSSMPGLSPDVFLLGWNFQSSYFELRPWHHNTTFGREANLKIENQPELYFSIEMEKTFIHSVISNLTPLAIAMTIVFFTLLISTRDKTRLEMLRTGVGFDIGISTSIFFVVVLSHIGLRERIVSEEVFYLEFFYLLMYFNLIWVCCHSILSGLNYRPLDKLTFGIAAKKAFFPVNFLLIFTFTWLTFYA